MEYRDLATGALRGTGDTLTPLVANLIAYWLIGLPLGYVLCFRLGWGPLGIWIGLCLGLMIIGSALLLVKHRRLTPIKVMAGGYGSSSPA